MSETQQQHNVAPIAFTAMLWQWKGTENRSFIQQILAKGLQHARHCCRHWRIGSEQDSQNLCSSRACFLVGGGVEMIAIYWLLCARRCSKCISVITHFSWSPGHLETLFFACFKKRNTEHRTVNSPAWDCKASGELGLGSRHPCVLNPTLNCFLPPSSREGGGAFH